MEQKFVKRKDHMSDAEMAEAKKLTLEAIASVINNENDFIFVGTRGGSEHVITMAGGKRDISQMVAQGMNALPELKKIIELANESYQYASGKANEKFGVPEDFVPFKCTDCDKKDECEIYELREKAGKSDNPVTEIMNLLGDILKNHDPNKVPVHMGGNLKTKGEC